MSEAILANGSEGRAAKEVLTALSARQQAKLVEFLMSLQVLAEGEEVVVLVPSTQGIQPEGGSAK